MSEFETNLVEEIAAEVNEEIAETVAEDITEESVEVPVEVVVETSTTGNSDGKCDCSVGTGQMAFTGNCGNCGSYNCLSVVVKGMFKCSTCKVQVSV